MKLMLPNNTPMHKWEDWVRPKRDYQWKPGRSAMELAQAWFRDGHVGVPEELAELLSNHQRLSGLDFIVGFPELVTPLPEKGEGRNHDLSLLCQAPFGNVTVCVEAKADEPFGNHTVAQYWSLAMKRREKGKATKAPERIQKLLSFVGEKEDDPTKSPWAKVRYQLLTAICGTAIQAQRDSSSLGVLVVHEFQTDSTKKDNLDRNMKDYQTFLRVILNDANIVIKSGCLYGPISVSGVDCLVGKITREKNGGRA